MPDFQIFQNIIIAVTFIGGVVLYTRNRIPQQNVKQLTELTATYEKRIKALEDEISTFKDQHLESVKAIADLQGQVKVYKDLPLQELASGIKQVSDTNREILDTLKASALILVKDTAKAAEAMRGVKKALEHEGG